LTIISEKPIFKIGERVFKYGNLANCDSKFVDSITDILDLGLKFVPNALVDQYSFFNCLVKSIDEKILDINKHIFFTKVNNNFNSNHLNREINTTSVIFSGMNDNSENVIEIDRIDEVIKSVSKKFSFKTPTDSSVYPIQNESILIRKSIIENLNANRFTFKNNISDTQLYYLKKYLRGETNFTILQCDKNVGAMIITKKDYKALIKEYLESNRETYEKINNNPLVNTIRLVGNKLKELYVNGDISKKLLKCLEINFKCKNGSLRLLPKIIKEKFSTRPIINCIFHPTSKICFFIDEILKPIVGKLPTVLKDSQELLQILDIFKNDRDNKLFLYSCDFESLYTKIKPNDAVEKIGDFIFDQNLVRTKHITKNGLKTLLYLVFNNNVFSINKEFFLQKIGLPMGCICGPTVANLYLYIIEKDWIDINNPKIYMRFIDDIFLANTIEINQETFSSHFGYLKLNICTGESVNFLDLKISFDNLTNKFMTDLYLKPTNTYSYLLTSSNHPEHIFKNIPLSLFIRIRRICSSKLAYIYHSKNLNLQLIRRGYDPQKVRSLSRKVGNINRLNLLPYKPKINNYVNNEKNINCMFKFDKNLSFLKKNFLDAFHLLKTKDNFLKNLKLNIYNSINTSIGAHLIHGFKSDDQFNNKKYCKKCNDSSCNVCFYLSETFMIKLNSFYLPILTDSNCQSSGVIYIITCLKCKVFYIGESERSASDRLNEHIKSIYNFNFNIPFSIGNLENMTEVAIHFNRKHHILNKHFKFYIFQKDLNDKRKRKSVETDLIHYCKALKIKILNKKIPDWKFIQKLSFS